MALFLTDLDGTLLDNYGRLSESSRNRLGLLLNKGLPFSFATARGWPGSRRVLGGLPLKLPVIVRNGAYVVDYQSGEILNGNLIDPALSKSIVAFLKERDCSPAIAAFVDGNEYMYGEPPRNTCMEAYATMRRQHGSPKWEEIAALEDLLHHPIAQFNIIDEGDKVFELKDDLLQAFPGLIQIHTYENAVRTGWRMLSLLDASATKGNAAQWLLDQLQIPIHLLTAFGDNHNDIPMLEVAGTAIAVGRAQPEVIQLAHKVLPYGSPDEVVNYIEENWGG